MTESPDQDFDVNAWLTRVAEEPIRPPHPPLVGRALANRLTAEGAVEGRDFIVYPDVQEEQQP